MCNPGNIIDVYETSNQNIGCNCNSKNELDQLFYAYKQAERGYNAPGVATCKGVVDFDLVTDSYGNKVVSIVIS